ncbi:MAG: acetate--CoA ligase family protein [Thermaerobacter sp.]|nr:GNAT family N-acetyltransferase [Bacillota bacterium]
MNDDAAPAAAGAVQDPAAPPAAPEDGPGGPDPAFETLKAVLRPRSVAVVGASRDPDSIGYRILYYLIANRFNGPVYPVNPNATVVGSIPAYPSLAQIPGPVDLAVIATPRDAVLPVVDQCGRKGVRGLVIITAGFAETGPEGRRLQDEVVARARSYGMRVIGPNCLGLINTAPDVRLNASFAPVVPPHGNISMSSQSGALGLAILQYAAAMGLGLSTFVSVGNQADVSGSDLIRYWEDDPSTDLILLYLESFGKPRQFARLARRVSRKKPILAVKAGRSPAGHRAAGSHTAALAASDVAVDALFRQAGVIRADTLDEMFDIAALLANQPLPQGPRVGIVTNAGGPGILATDALVGLGLEVPETSPETRQRLAQVMPAAASLGNPIDMIASAGPHHYRAAVAAALDDPAFDAVLVIFVPVELADPQAVNQAVREAVAEARARGNRKPVLCCFLDSRGLAPAAQPAAGSPLGRGIAAGASGERIPSYVFPESAARALARAYEYARWRSRPAGEFPRFDDVDPEQARKVLHAARDRGDRWLGPEDVAAVLQAYRLPLIPGRLARTPDEAAAAAADLGFPVVVKLASRTIVHKTEWEGVALDLETADVVRSACRRIEDRLRAAGRHEELDGFLVQPMVKGGVELLVGMTDDPLFGPLIAFGLGGIHVEILRDVVVRITPLSDRDADEMIRGIRGYRLLTGYRGHPPADIDAIRQVLLRLSQLVEDLPEIAEIDLNPVKAFPPGQGCRILDARIRLD